MWLSVLCTPSSMNNCTLICIGYAFLLFQDESSVQALIDACIEEDGKLYLCVSSPTIKDKPVSGNTHTRTLSCSAVMNSVKLAVITLTWLFLFLFSCWNLFAFSLFDRSRSAHGTWTTVILWWMDLSLWTQGKPYLWAGSLVLFVQVPHIFMFVFLQQVNSV